MAYKRIIQLTLSIPFRKVYLTPLCIKSFRINEQISDAPAVRLIDFEGEQLGIVGIEKARELAREAGVDLVEVSPKAKPPVCRIMDYGKHLYEQKKADKKQKRLQKQTEVKGIRVTLRISEHDMQTKIKQAKGFLEEGNLVKFSLIFKGREHSHSELGFKKFEKFIDELKEVATIDTVPKKQGSKLMMILAPKN